MEAIDKSTDAEESDKDCSGHYEARENTCTMLDWFRENTRKLLFDFKVRGPRPEHLLRWWRKLIFGISSRFCPLSLCSFKSLGIEKCGGKPVRGGSLSI